MEEGGGRAALTSASALQEKKIRGTSISKRVGRKGGCSTLSNTQRVGR